MNYNTQFIEPKFLKARALIDYSSSAFFIGSCFSLSISERLSERKFKVLSNPYGTLFDPMAILNCIKDISSSKSYGKSDLFYSNELFASWSHHSSFSNISERSVLDTINNTIVHSKSFLEKSSHVFITLGTAYSYFHIDENRWVANCHKADQKSFHKRLLTVESIVECLVSMYECLKQLKSDINIVLTISPVRHIKDGLIENNRSKARLIEAVQLFIEEHPETYYFPSYEIMVDVLRDYRYYDGDFVHPNNLGTNSVFEYFKSLCINPKSHEKMDAFYQLSLAKKHKAMHPKTNQHKAFLKAQLKKAEKFALENPNIDFREEIKHFESKIRN